MFWLEWDFALVAARSRPYCCCSSCGSGGQSGATRELRQRRERSAQRGEQGLESIRVVNAFGRQELEEKTRGGRESAGRPGRVAGETGEIAPLACRDRDRVLCTGFVLWRGASLASASAMTTRIARCLSFVFGKSQTRAGHPKMSGKIAQAAVGVERVRAILTST